MKDYEKPIDFSTPAMQERLKLPEGKISEIINGVLYVWPSSPSVKHQIAVKNIAFELHSFADAKGLGLTLFAPIDLYLVPRDVVLVPDIVFISEDNNDGLIDEHGLHGAPDLIVEVLSPYTKRRDQIAKKLLYQSVGVKEYWLVDPKSKETWGYIRKNQRYGEPLMMQSKLHIRILDKIITF